MNADDTKRSINIAENDQVQREIIRQKQGALVLIIIFFVLAAIGHLALKYHVIPTISNVVHQGASKQFNRHREL